MKEYCLGFAFDYTLDRERVCLIRKNKPAWMKGKLNGVGGLVEPNESPRQAMVREFREETGLDIPADRWTYFACMDFGECRVFCFTSNLKSSVPVSTTDESVDMFDTSLVEFIDPMENLCWLLPMARNFLDSVRKNKPLIIQSE